MSKTDEEKRLETEKLFLSNFDAESTIKLLQFISFWCPIAITEVIVKEHVVEDYEALELLTLRLYDAGFRSTEAIAGLSGMKEEIIERALNNEIFVYRHINNETGEISEMGRRTLAENSNGIANAKNHVIYDTPRRMQIEAITGTVIPRFMEVDERKMSQAVIDNERCIVPIQTVNYDDELRSEINTRLLEYKNRDILDKGDTITEIVKIQPMQMYYRKAYLAKFEGMIYPMIVFQGFKSIDKINFNSKKISNFGDKIAVPLSIACTDYEYLRSKGFRVNEILVREDTAFSYLSEKLEVFDKSRNDMP